MPHDTDDPDEQFAAALLRFWVVARSKIRLPKTEKVIDQVLDERMKQKNGTAT